MAQYWLEVTSSTSLAQFTEVVSTAGDGTVIFEVVDDSGTDALRLGRNGNGFVLQLWDTVGNADTVDMMVYVRHSATLTSGWKGPVVRAGSSTIDGYECNARNGALQLNRMDSETLTELGRDTGIIADPTAYHWRAITASGSTISAYGWEGTAAQGDQRPATPNLSVTDTTHSGSKPVGISNGINTTLSDTYYHIISVGTDGDAAPTGPVGGTIPTLSAPGVTEIGSTSVRPQITLTF